MPYILVENAADLRSARPLRVLERNAWTQVLSVRLASATWDQKLSKACSLPSSRQQVQSRFYDCTCKQLPNCRVAIRPFDCTGMTSILTAWSRRVWSVLHTSS